jgi:hypothetical protein
MITTGFDQPNSICDGSAIPLREVDSALRMTDLLGRKLRKELGF